MEKAAVLSDDGVYRYFLSRIWEPRKGLVTFVMLNPSTADAEMDDPTIRRCIGFTDLWGFGGLNVVNLFAYRATNPKELKVSSDPVGPKNDLYLLKTCRGQGIVVAAWGANGGINNRAERVMSMLRKDTYPVLCLGVTKNDHPKHPLYIPASKKLEVFLYGI